MYTLCYLHVTLSKAICVSVYTTASDELLQAIHQISDPNISSITTITTTTNSKKYNIKSCCCRSRRKILTVITVSYAVLDKMRKLIMCFFNTLKRAQWRNYGDGLGGHDPPITPWPPPLVPPFKFWLCTLHCDADLLPSPPTPIKTQLRHWKSIPWSFPRRVSLSLSGPLSRVLRHKTVNKMYWVRHQIKQFLWNPICLS